MNILERRDQLRLELAEVQNELFFSKFGIETSESYEKLRVQQKALIARIAIINFRLTGDMP